MAVGCVTNAAWQRAKGSLDRLEGKHHGGRDSEVVQRGKGVWFHRTGEWRPSRLCPLLEHHCPRISGTAGGPEGLLRRHPGSEGSAGREHPPGLTDRTRSNPPPLVKWSDRYSGSRAGVESSPTPRSSRRLS